MSRALSADELASRTARAVEAAAAAARELGLSVTEPEVLHDAFPDLPMLAQALLPIVEQWRALPFAGGLAEA